MIKQERESTSQILHNIADILSHDVEKKVGKANKTLLSRVPSFVWKQLAVLALVTVIAFIVTNVYDSIRQTVTWEARPSAIDRIKVPYEVSALVAPVPQEGFYVILDSYGAFELQEEATVSALLERCMLSAIDPEVSTVSAVPYNCGIRYTADYQEVHTYQNSEGSVVNLIMLQITEPVVNAVESGQAPNLYTRAKLTLRDIQEFARNIGRIGNFSLLADQSVNYFYSSTRTRFSFTWTKDDWIFSVTGDSFEAIDSFMQNFGFAAITTDAS